MYKDISFCTAQQHTQTHMCVCVCVCVCCCTVQNEISLCTHTHTHTHACTRMRTGVHSKGKGKGQNRIGHKAMYSSTLALNLMLDGGGWSTPCLSCFNPGKVTQYPLYRRLGGPLGQSGGVQKISPSPGFNSCIVQLVANRDSVVSIDWLHYPSPCRCTVHST